MGLLRLLPCASVTDCCGAETRMTGKNLWQAFASDCRAFGRCCMSARQIKRACATMMIRRRQSSWCQVAPQQPRSSSNTVRAVGLRNCSQAYFRANDEAVRGGGIQHQCLIINGGYRPS
jgi:hypothetical protein